jgi:3-isopropylmalate dehydrogenase
MVLSAKMMLDWLGERHDIQACRDAADDLTNAIEASFSSGEIVPLELGGNDGTTSYTRKLLTKLH